MASLMRSIKRRAPYALVMPWFRAREAVHDTLDYAVAGARLGIPTLRRAHLERHKSSDTLFVLGSGSSIRTITPAQWDVVRAHDSFGFNFWCAHEHVPTYYSFELIGTEGPIRQAAVEANRALMASRDDYAEVPKIAVELRNHRLGFWETVPASWRTNCYRARTPYGFARSEDDLAQYLRFLDAIGHFSPWRTDLSSLFKYRGSLSTVLAIAAILDYRHVVLCGIDMIDSPYFYDDAERYPIMARACAAMASYTARHPTSHETEFMIGAPAVVRVFDALIFRPRAIELSVINETSALHPDVPLYEWPAS